MVAEHYTNVVCMSVSLQNSALVIEIENELDKAALKTHRTPCEWCLT